MKFDYPGAIGRASVHDSIYESNVDTGTKTVDSFADTDAKAAFWVYVLSKGANVRAGKIMAAWDAGSDAMVYSESSTTDVGDTSDVSFAVDIDSNIVRLRCTVLSDDWSVEAVRILTG